MGRYILKRLIYTIPTLIIITLLTFFISLNTPGDPINRQLRGGIKSGPQSATAYWKAYEDKREELGLHLPVFYFSLSRMAVPDTLHRIPIPEHRAMLQAMIWEYGNWRMIQVHYVLLRKFYRDIINEPAVSDELKKLVYQLLTAEDISFIKEGMQQFETYKDGPNGKRVETISSFFNQIPSRSTKWKNFVPSIHWHGLSNQYHVWLFGNDKNKDGLIRGDFGNSYRNNRPVTQILNQAIGITLQMTLAALVIAFLIAIPLGIYSASQKDTIFDHSVSTTLFALYGMPAFWIGTLLIIFLGGGDYLKWFPPFGLGNIEGLGFWQGLQVRLWHLVLPVFCLVYPLLAFLARQARGGAINVMQLPFITTARAKGISRHNVLWKHNFRNALLPIITLLGNILPFAIGGSVMVEVVFSIPGMGKVSLDALYARDYPVVFAAVLITTFVTIAGYLLADILYSLADPRINYKKDRS